MHDTPLAPRLKELGAVVVTNQPRSSLSKNDNGVACGNPTKPSEETYVTHLVSDEQDIDPKLGSTGPTPGFALHDAE